MTYYHGGRARLAPGGEIRPGHRPNPWGDQARPEFVYCTTSLDTAEAYADAVRERTGRKAYVYEVEPTGELLHDRSGVDFKTRHPLRVIERLS